MGLVIRQEPSRYVRSAVLAWASGRVVLTVVAWEPEGERPWIAELSADDGRCLRMAPVGRTDPRGVLGTARVIAAGNVWVVGWLSVDGPCALEIDPATFEPAAEVQRSRELGSTGLRAMAGAELVAMAGETSVLCHVEAGRSVVELLEQGRRPIRVWEGEGTALAPTMARGPEGVWVAWHSNATSGRVDVAKWIDLRLVDSKGRVRRPRAAMLGRELDAHGEQQGFEYPTIVRHASGALTILGRGSHRFWAQQLDDRGFGARVPLGDGEWGCRGRRVAAVLLEDDWLLCARREKPGIVVERIAAPEGGAPRTVEVEKVRARRKRPPAPARRPRRDVDGRLLLFGDIHQHSAHSDGVGAADEAYFRARDQYRDDFAALTDHESFLGKRIGPGEQAFLEAVAESHHEPGRFSTLFAYEWTAKMFPGPGHKVIYLPRAGLPIVSRDGAETSTGVGLLREVRRLGGFAVPHHTGWTGADLESHNPQDQPVWEVCSVHGCYESCGNVLGHRGALAGQFAGEALEAGLVFGFVGASDSHGLLWHHGIARKRDPFRTGLTAVLALENERGAILDAMRARRCYATSGAKIRLDVRAGGAMPMGSELVTSGEVALTARASGTAPVARLVLVGHGGDLDSRETHGGEVVEAEWRVAADPKRGWSFFYVRVEQQDGERAWSSPIWVRLSR
ncbi:MAG: DUF3604 domain-containing protein [Deltaproteobacteria bacterium]|nr:DUF3604 domain-containing protein [Deltaproteobacteria bacterium]